ncbi:MAG TPA: nitroreductase family protein, partial [Bacillota bacterium]|nr:nitroreductase family protein [Bacillota bacterium]
RGAEFYCIQDTAAATQNLLLTATAYGLGSCWVGSFDEHQIRQTLHLDAGLKPVALIPVGYAAEEPPEVPRRSIDEVTLIM